MPVGPFTVDNKEQESNIRDYRMDRGYTCKELADLCGTYPSQITGLQSGMISPISKGRNGYKGQLKPCVQKMLKVLDITAEQAFPRYYCKIVKDGEGFTGDQLNAMFNRPDLEHELEVLLTFKSLPFHRLDDNQKFVLERRFLQDLTLEETGEELGGLTRERVRQIEAKALRLLRKPFVVKGF